MPEHGRQPELAAQTDHGVAERLEQHARPDGDVVAVAAGLAALVTGLLLELRDLGPELAHLAVQPGRCLLGPAPSLLGLLASGALLGPGLAERAPQRGHLGLQRVERLLVAAPLLAQRALGLVGTVAQPLLALLLLRAVLRLR